MNHKVICGKCGKVPDRIQSLKSVSFYREELICYCSRCNFAFNLLTYKEEIPNKIENPSLDDFRKHTTTLTPKSYLYALDFMYNHLHKFGEILRDDDGAICGFIAKNDENRG